jgi:hypothetical protein
LQRLIHTNRDNIMDCNINSSSSHNRDSTGRSTDQNHHQAADAVMVHQAARLSRGTSFRSAQRHRTPPDELQLDESVR